MKPIVAVIAPGAMGSGVGQRLAENGVDVVTSLAGRGAASAARAKAAGMRAVEDTTLGEAEAILSIVPPGNALELAERLAPVLRAAPRKPLYVDCNAVSPDTVRHIAAVVQATGASFVDGGIIGGPPKPGSTGTKIYVSGPEAQRAAKLAEHGLEMRVLGTQVGEASALKMSYAGITKGFTALGAAMMLAATREGSAAALHAELADSQKALLAWLTRQVPNMYAKAYRWVAEMEEIAAFAGEDPAAAQLYDAAARLYERIAVDVDGGGREVGALSEFCAMTSEL
jgi:3-hydroxyisobutyrate dehydrogenase-like beta-hydroxyacid dehydrogenase